MKKLYLLAICIALILSTACSYTSQQEVKSTVLDTVNSVEIESIKNMITEKNVKLGDLFEAGMSSCTYDLYDPAEDGNTYVTVSGNISYNKNPVVATIQYKQNSESNYEFYTVVLNDMPMNQLESAEFFNYLYESYYDQYSNVDSDSSTKEQTISENNSVEMNKNSSDDFLQIIKELSKHGLTVSIDEVDNQVYKIEDVENVLFYDEMSLVDFDKIDIGTSEYPINSWPMSYSIFNLNSNNKGLYVSYGGDGTFETKIYVPVSTGTIKITIFENFWDEDYDSDFVKSSYEELLEYAKSIG